MASIHGADRGTIVLGRNTNSVGLLDNFCGIPETRGELFLIVGQVVRPTKMSAGRTKLWGLILGNPFILEPTKTGAYDQSVPMDREGLE